MWRSRVSTPRFQPRQKDRFPEATAVAHRLSANRQAARSQGPPELSASPLAQPRPGPAWQRHLPNEHPQMWLAQRRPKESGVLAWHPPDQASRLEGVRPYRQATVRLPASSVNKSFVRRSQTCPLVASPAPSPFARGKVPAHLNNPAAFVKGSRNGFAGTTAGGFVFQRFAGRFFYCSPRLAVYLLNEQLLAKVLSSSEINRACPGAPPTTLLQATDNRPRRRHQGQQALVF